MKLILLRHALQDALAAMSGGSPGLSSKGRKQQRATNQYLQEQGFCPGCIYTSPARRATETAQMGGEWFSCPVVIEPALGSDFRQERLIELLKEEPREMICFVGHAPTLVDFAQQLVGSAQIPDIGRSCALVLDIDREEGELHARPIAYITHEGIENPIT